jgi:hypothetical protein
MPEPIPADPTDGDVKPPEKGGDSRRRRRRVLGVLVFVVGLIGLGLVGYGLWGITPEAAPEPTAFSVSPGAITGTGDPAQPHLTAADLGADRLWIPSLGVNAAIEAGNIVVNSGSRTLEIPADPAKLTRYAEGAAPCDQSGTVLLAGHVSSYGTRGALYPLSQIKPNAAVYLTCSNGSPTTWQVTSVTVTEKFEFPQNLFTKTGTRRAAIVTCGGPVMSDGHYRDNVIVELVPVTG